MRVAIHPVGPSKGKLYAGLWLTLIAAIALLGWEDFDIISADADNGASQASLTVNPWHGKLQLRWNPATEPVRSAQRAAILIRDGDRRTQVPLTAQVLRNGNIVYQPLTADVTFQLQTFGAAPSTESLRYLAAIPTPAVSKANPFAETGTADRAVIHRATLRPQPVPVAAIPSAPSKPPGPFSRVKHEFTKLWPFHHNSDGGQP
jgi:hypothetical protein